MKRIDELMQRYPGLSAQKGQLELACGILQQTVLGGGKIMTCGNGGSASDAEHIVGELMKQFCRRRPMDARTAETLRRTDPSPDDLICGLQGTIPALSLNSQTSLITAVCNDTDPAMIFAQQLYGYGRPGDALIALSTSGNSKNVLNAVRLARAIQVRTVLISGRSGGKMKSLADAAICLPEDETFKIQELTLPVYHALCLELEDAVFGRE